jgi:hypothetical protein
MGRNDEEWRTWPTSYRGDLYIHCGLKTDREECRRARLDPGKLPHGILLCRVELFDVVPDEDGFAWKLRNPRPVPPEKLRGKLGLWSA